MAVKTVDGCIYLSLPDENFTLYLDNGHGMKEFCRIEEISSEKLKDLQKNYPKESFFKEEKNNEKFYEFSFTTTVPTRRDYSIPIELEFPDKDYFGDIEISLFKNEGDIVSFSLLTENNETIKGIFVYDFRASI